MKVKLNNYVIIILVFLLIAYNSNAQRDSVYWHYGLKLNYSAIFYPKRSPYLFYKYSQSFGLSSFLEKTFRKKQKFNLSMEIGYNILKLNEKLFRLDSTAWQENPKNFDNVCFTYHNVNFNISLNKKISRLYTFGGGISFNYFKLTKKNGYTPYVHYPSSNCVNCINTYYVLDYYVMEKSYSAYIMINNSFTFYKNHSFGLNLILDPLNLYYRSSEPRIPFSGYTFYTGVNIESLNYFNVNYKYYIR